VTASFHGVIVIDKPAGATSHDVVRLVRWALREKSVGHCGTLDPAATGVLVVCVGEATKLASVLHSADKRYRAEVVLGRATTTGDADGDEIAAMELDDAAITRAVATAELLRGTLPLPPPAFSAIKQGGVAAHVRARRGEDVQLEPRDMIVHEVHVLGRDRDRISVELLVGKGTYVRSWAVALGDAIGVPAHLGSLRRLASGPLSIDDPNVVHGLCAIATPRTSGKPRARLELAGAIDRDAARDRLRVAVLDPIASLPADWVRAVAPDGERFERLCQGLPQWAELVGMPPDLGGPGHGAVTEPSGNRLVLVRLEPQPEGLRAIPTRLLRLGPAA
jgi:tRNA pseudouridine55 synthase